MKKYFPLFIIGTTIIVASLIVGYIYTRPVSWDAGACSGGYIYHIFDKYNGILVEKFSNTKEDLVYLTVSRETATAEMTGRKIKLAFDVEYEIDSGETFKERISFIGKRYWISSFAWSNPILEHSY